MARRAQLPAEAYGSAASWLLARYYKGPDHVCKLRLLRRIEQLLGKKRIICSTDAGFLMALDQADLVQRTVLYTGSWEPELTEMLEAELRPDDVFYDIGANVGYFTCLALQKCVKHAVSFDPDPLNVAVLELNLRLNRIAPGRVTVVAKGVSSASGRLMFNRASAANTGVSGFRAATSGVSFPVDVDTLDRMITGGRWPLPTVMKIDVEGWEEQVLRSAAALLRSHPPRLIVFEADCNPNGSMRSLELLSLVRSFGYTVRRLSSDERATDVKENYVARRP